MSAPEKQGEGQATLKSGVYRHRETGEELICLETSKFGNPQADAAVRLGFEYVGDAPKETPKVLDPHAAPTATPMGVKSVAELEAELAAAKQRESQFKANREQVEEVQKENQQKAADETVERETARKEQLEAQTKSDEKVAEAKKGGK